MKDVNILIFGDSIAYGACDKENLGWVNRLRFTLEKNKKNDYYNVFNLSVPGDTTIELKNRFRNECNARYNSNMHNIIIFSIGVNDSQIINNTNHVSEDSFKKNIVKLVAQALQYTEKILFVGLTPVDNSRVNSLSWNPSITYTNDEVSKFNIYLKDVCSRCSTKYLNIFDLLNNDDLEDGLHPNSVGHQKIYEKIYQYLEDLNWI